MSFAGMMQGLQHTLQPEQEETLERVQRVFASVDEAREIVELTLADWNAKKTAEIVNTLQNALNEYMSSDWANDYDHSKRLEVLRRHCRETSQTW